MREILFRGKSKNKKYWVYGDLIHDENGYSIIEKKGGCIKVKPETIGQYTGCKDKNKNKIFENDILKVAENYYDYAIFSNGCFCLKRAVMFYEFTYGVSDYEVVGNIYDNPELLEKVEE